MRPVAGLLLLTLLAAPIEAKPRELQVTDRDGLERALASAKPGTRILVAPGTYAGGLRAVGLEGTKAKPIVIAGADPERPPVIRGGTSGLHLTDPVHVVLRDLVFEQASGNGLNIDDGGTPDTPAHDLVLRRVTVRDVGPGGNCDGIKLSGVERSTIRSCIVERWGSGGSAIDMVGCHDMTIERCMIHGARGAGASGIQAKGGSRAVRITRCSFRDAGGRAVNAGGSTGLPYFRPRDARYEAKDITVEDCTFSGSQAPVAFVGCDGGVFRHNLVYRPRRWVLRILQESRAERFVPCRLGRFENNLVVFRRDELRSVVNIGPGTDARSFRFRGNAWFCEDEPKQTQARVKLPTREQGGVYGVEPKLRNPARGDFAFSRKGALKGVGPHPR